MKAVHLEPGQPARLVDIQTTSYRHLAQVFPDSFDGIRLGGGRLGVGVIGYVGDTSLLDGSPANPAAKALADACYQAAAGRPYHTPVCGPMVVLGITPSGSSTSVPDSFIRKFLPQLLASPDGAPSDGGTVFAPVTSRCIGNPDAGYQFVYGLELDHASPALPDAAIDYAHAVGHDDFLIGEATADGATLVDLLCPDGQPLPSWGQESYREVAAGVGATWAPKPGTVAAAAPEQDPAGEVTR